VKLNTEKERTYNC